MANNYSNLSTSLVATAPSPATTGTSLVVTAGHGTRFPAVPFYATVHPDYTYPTFDNSEIVLVTNISTDTLTIDREEKSTTAQSIAIGWRISAGIYAEDFIGQLGAIHRYEFDGTDIFIDGVDQNNGDNTVDWTKPSNLKFVIVEVQAGGGGAGAAPLNGGTGVTGGGGGGGGGYAKSRVMAASLGTTEVVTVGAGGPGGTTGTGTVGGDSSFGAHAVALGGTAGTARNGVGPTTSSPGGDVTTGNIKIPGGPGGYAVVIDADSVAGGSGGSSHLGSGGRGHSTNSGGDQTGVVGWGYGGGGGGGYNDDNTSAQAGGDGAPGIIIVYEYY